MRGSYLYNQYPLEALRVLSGFAKERGSYYLERAAEVPDEKLLNMVIIRTYSAYLQSGISSIEVQRSIDLNRRARARR